MPSIIGIRRRNERDTTNSGARCPAYRGGENATLQTAGSDLQAQMQPVDLSQMPGATPDNPMYIIDTGRPEVQKVEIVNTPKMVVDGGVLDGVRNPVDVKQVGVVQVSQGGEFVVQLAGGGTIPVRVEGGRMVVDIAGGLEGLAVNLADTEVGLRAVGAI